jgi:hypothetical protein
MNDRSESGGAIVAVGVALLLMSILLVGGGSMWVLFARQQAAVRAEAMMARAAEAEARLHLEKARSEQELAKAQTIAAKQTLTPANDEPADAAIKAMLQTQAEAWNNGDINKFMEHYWKSDEPAVAGIRLVVGTRH